MKYSNLLLVLLILLLVNSTSAQQLLASPHYVKVYTNDTIQIQINISNINNLFAASVKVEFDNTHIKCSRILEGDFLGNNNGGFPVHFTSFPSLPDSNTNTIIVDQAILGTSSSSGDGNLFTLYFIPLTTDSTTISITEFTLRDNNNNEITATAENGSVKTGINTKLKVNLGGAYNNGSMTTILNNSGILPLIQPYNSLPDLYNGNENVQTGFYASNPDIVDWVLLELRKSISPQTILNRRACFIKSNGSIVDTNGVSPVGFDTIADFYYVVIRHRNHLSIMTNNPLSLGISSELFDFTLTDENVYGTEAVYEVEPGIFAMYPGDADMNGIIDAQDRLKVWNSKNSTGYISEDVLIDLIIDASDRLLIWNNKNKITQVP